ncbi:MAG: hypothetical protein ACK493_05725 [Planctomycetota bacterium]|jgi:hypothetical protein
MRSLSFLVFVALTVICWGIYGPVLHEGQHAMGADGKLSSLRPYICVGAAYFLIAVIFPIAILTTKGEKGNWTLGGFIWSLGAGAIGALGALGIILAFKFQGKPAYVMPLVFGFAPVVNTFCTMFFSRTFKEASALFYTGVAIVAIGAAGVLILKPKEAVKDNHQEQPAAVNAAAAPSKNEPSSKSDQPTGNADEAPASDAPAAEATPAAEAGNAVNKPVSRLQQLEQKAVNWLAVGLSIALTALCWGSYGPVLHKGQMKMGQSRLRPFLCVGLAYFVIAVVAAFFLLQQFPEPGGWNTSGVIWSLLGGTAGAFGALGIIYAFNFGGKPIFVMPLVFGLAPVVNTFTEITSKGLRAEVSSAFYLSLAVTILGAVMVLVCAPKGPVKPPAASPEAAH